jgi:ATP/maltotriose-dependent transcriptional regulator MalT
MKFTPPIIKQDNSEPSSLAQLDFLGSIVIWNIIPISVLIQNQSGSLPPEILQCHVLTNAVKLNHDYESSAILPQQLGESHFNHVLVRVAEEAAERLQQAYSVQTDSVNDSVETISIRENEPEYRKIMGIEPLTIRELEVLQLIVDGYSNSVIAEKLYITLGTVKSYVRNVLGKLCVSDRTQAAIRALRSGLVH